MKRSVSVLASAIIASAALCGCSVERDQKEEISYVPPEVERYENHIEIDGQWGASWATGANGQYGVGDPFVMRFNGKYYLYPSTSDPCDGIKVFSSDDLVHWTYEGLAVAESEKTAHGAYAPEVVYYDGYFYLCQSRGGNGHYIYRSESPTEGFTLFSRTEGLETDNINYGNLGMGIDGSFYVSDDGRLYLLHTSTPTGLKFNEFTDVNSITGSTVGETGNLGESGLSGWIEGPGIIRRGNFSYLTYTGNHVISKGYRIGYSYAENLSGLNGFTQPDDNVTIMDTDDDHYGLGHSSNTVGPNLDSMYTAYHSLVGNGPARRYNVDRYFASGALLTANGVTHRPVAMPEQADAFGYADALKEEGGLYCIGAVEDYFTAEYNFVPNAGQELAFGAYRVKIADGKITLMKNAKTVAETALSLAAGKLVCVRVENGDGVGYIYVNGMRVISYKAESTKGSVGYTQKEGVGYTAVSGDVFGTSDFEAFKNFPTRFPATSYLKGEMRGFSIANAKRQTGGVRVGEKESTKRIGDYYAVALAQNDWIKYAVDVGADAEYLLTAEVSTESAGAELTVTVGDAVLTAKIPQVAAEEDYETVRVPLGRISLKAGVQTMRVQVNSGKADFVWFEATEQESGEISLTDFRAFGSAKMQDGALVVTGTPNGSDAAAVFNHSIVSDTEIEIEFQATVDSGTNVGLMIRAAHYSLYSAQPTQSWRGYYLQFGSSLLSLRRYDYGDCGTVDSERLGDISFAGDTHKIVLRTQGNAFYAILDDTVTLTGSDGNAFFGGGLGVYAGSGEIKILSLKYKTIQE